ncbi:tyrosine-type recombinase/integrase [Burkholderia cenocepacia]|uniref:tyrosine-type recombinase/integrase n=1 Tax=Burkholderia cenocepacia TaxID=95486 RepID=UPI001B90D053|nr:tyrosine-type recombinase/integrase [Burkholderia cenocepacia]MBR8027065.1 tyrosine-type recombinase/integrase [Burkholderia cenocepacia]MBR8169344.1 tyrosine-type recombinase/integrase [Burkholderia cenocepacia]
MRFDARIAAKLPSGEHMTFEGFPGLRLQASASRKSWTYRYKSPVDGRMRQVKLGEWPAMAFAAAIAAWETNRVERDTGAELSALRRKKERAAARPSPDDYTVRQLCRDYLEGYVEVNRKAKGAAEVARIFKAMLDQIADMRAATITRAQAFDFLESYRATPMLASRLRMELGCAWHYALDAGRLPEDTANWWREVLRGRLKSKGRKVEGKYTGTQKRVLSVDELGALIRWLPNFSLTVADALTLYLWTGTRGGEIVSMESTEIADEADGLWWTIPKQKTKGLHNERATDLRVPLVGRAEIVVRRRLEQAKGTFLFPSSRGTSMDQTVVQHGVYYHQPYCKIAPTHDRPRLAVTHWSAHDLRRTTRTMLATLGCPNEIAEAVLGHVQPGIVGIYNRHTYDRERRDWLTHLSRRLEEVASTYPAKK